MALLLTMLAGAGFAGCSSHDWTATPFEERDRAPRPLARYLQAPPLESESVDGQADIDSILDQSTLTRRDLVRIAVERNPEWAAARAEIGAADARALEASLGLNPELEFEVEEVRVEDGGFGSSETAVAFVQPIRLGGQREAAMELADVDRAIARAEAEITLWELIGDVNAAATEIASLSEQIDAIDAILTDARSVADIAQQRFDARATPESDVTRTRVVVADLEMLSERLTYERAGLLAQLTRMLGGVEIAPEQIEVRSPQSDSAPAPDVLVESALRRHPRIEAARLAVDRARREVELAQAESKPTIGVRFGYARNHEMDDNRIEGGVSIPLAIADRNQGRILEARYRVIRASRLVEAAEHEIKTDVARFHAAYQAAEAELSRYRDELLPLMEQAVEQTRAGYEAGRLSLMDLLDAQRTWIDGRLRRRELQRDRAVAMAQLESLTGGMVIDPDASSTPSEPFEPPTKESPP